jgi:hypothetical protein
LQTKDWADPVISSLFQQEIQQQSENILLPSFLLDYNYVSKLGAYNHYLTFGG